MSHTHTHVQLKGREKRDELGREGWLGGLCLGILV
jgi:hypothetical protein